MSVILNTSLEGLIRTTNLIPKTSDMTVAFFVRYIATPGTTLGTLWYWGDNPATTYNDYVFIGMNTSDEITLDVGLNGSTSIETFALPDFGLYYIVYVRNGTTHELWVNGIKEISQVLDINIAGFTAPTHQYYGTDTIAADWNAQEAAYYREWNVALIGTEIIAEMQSANFAVVKTANLWVDTPFVADILDDSGNGYDWTLVTGSLTFTTGVLNQSDVNARPVILLPVSFSQNAVSGATTYDLWYKYVALSTELEMGVFGFGDLVTYLPKLHVETGSVGSLVTYLSLGGVGPNDPVQIPIVASTIYYFRFQTNSGNPSPAVLILSLVAAPTSTIPTGTLIINDDTQGFPAVFIDKDSGRVINFAVPFPAGEGGAQLPDGESLFEDFGDGDMVAFNNKYDRGTATAFANGFVFVGAQDTLDNFWAGNSANPTIVRVISKTGVFGATHTLTGFNSLGGISANNDGTIIYVGANSATAPVKRWDTVGNAFLSDLAVGVAGAGIFDILYLAAADEILVNFSDNIPSLFQVKRYNPAGTLLETYNLVGGSDVYPAGTRPRISLSDTPATHFWSMQHETGVSRWKKVTIAGGAIATNISITEYEAGLYQGTAAAIPTARFGNSFSCPLVVHRGPPITTTNTGSGGTPSVLVPAAQSTTGGLYQVVPTVKGVSKKLNDTLWVSFPSTTQDVKKPNPTGQTGLIGE